jgi:hypothetical protein
LNEPFSAAADEQQTGLDELLTSSVEEEDAAALDDDVNLVTSMRLLRIASAGA